MTHRFLKLFCTLLFAVWASASSAMFISPDPLDPTSPGIGTNRYAYSLNDPINRMDPSGYDSVWSNGDGTWSSSDGSTWDSETRTGTYDFGSDEYGYTNGLGVSPAELPGYQSNDDIVSLPSSGRTRVISASSPSYRDNEDGVVYEGHALYSPSSPFDSSAANSYQLNALQRSVAIAAGFQGPQLYGEALVTGATVPLGYGAGRLVGPVFGRSGPLLPESYWITRTAPTQVTPGTRMVVNPAKPSSAGGTYHSTTHYDPFGRIVGQTHRTTHGRPAVHPNPHHHRYDPTGVPPGQIRAPNGSRTWPGFFGN